jgi:glycosyltransferase involved in cell wall biosynthesis
MSRLAVFVPAWNEEENLPAVLDELHRELPGADVLVIDDGSTDRTAEVARAKGAIVVSFLENRGLREGIATGYAEVHERGYDLCGRVDADGQHPAHELARLVDLVAAGTCDVAIGSRFVHGPDHPAYRYRLRGARRFGTALMRRVLTIVLRRRVHDPMSGMYAANRRAMEVLSRPYTSEAPEVEALMRITRAGLRLEEVPVDMRLRAIGESKLRGRKALGVVLTVVATLWAGRRLAVRRRS